MQESGKSIDEITDDLNKNSGFLGIAGAADCRDVEKMALEEEENAVLAMQMYSDRIVKYIADYYIELKGDVDSIVFTAGVLENGSYMRKLIIDKLSPLGITLNSDMNDKIASFKDIHEGVISTKKSKVPVWVLPTNEELMIIKDTYEIVNKK